MMKADMMSASTREFHSMESMSVFIALWSDPKMPHQKEHRRGVSEQAEEENRHKAA